MKSLKKFKKDSFSLIELILAIIIIGISVASIPMLLSTVSKNNSINLKSNSFYNAFSTLALIESMAWDEKNTNGDNFNKVLVATKGDSELNCPRKGVQQLNNKSGAECSSDTTSPIGVDSGEKSGDSSTFDDVDDFNGQEVDIDKYKIKISVSYVNDNANYSAGTIFYNDASSLSNNTNIKEIKLKVYKKDNNQLISIIRGKSDNIGKVKIYSRDDL